MDLHEEYWSRRSILGPLVKFTENGNAILRAKPNSGAEWNWLQLSVQWIPENNHPGNYKFRVAANPVIYASPDFAHFSYHHTKILDERVVTWDDYESEMVKWGELYRNHYSAVSSRDAMFVSWELFCVNYDPWIAQFFPYRLVDWLEKSLEGDAGRRTDYIGRIESWLREHYERVFQCWKQIRTSLDRNTYMDWLVRIVNQQGPWQPVKSAEGCINWFAD